MIKENHQLKPVQNLDNPSLNVHKAHETQSTLRFCIVESCTPTRSKVSHMRYFSGGLHIDYL